MKEILKERITNKLREMISNEDLSMTEKVARVHQYFSYFNGKNKNGNMNVSFNFETPEPGSIKNRIYDIHEKPTQDLYKFFEREINYIVDIILYEMCDNLASNYE